MGKCETPYCRNNTKGKRNYCWKCYKQHQRKRKPFKYFYNQHKQKAKQRGLAWDLTFEQYRQLWLKHPKKWLEKLSSNTSHWEIDRIDNRKGYIPGNVQIITKTKNVQKYHVHDKFMMDVTWTDKPQPTENDAPF